MKIMALQHADKYHEARDWICLQDQDTLTYQSLLAHCKQLEARFKQFQQAQAQGRAHLTSITATSAPTITGTQLTIPASRESQEAGPTGPVATDIPAGQPAEAGSLTETTPTTPEEVSAPATAHHKTITREDHPNAGDAAPHHIGIMLAILNHLIPTPKLVKVTSSLKRHLLATDLFIQYCS